MKHMFSASHDTRIHFLGLWDTVSSVSWAFRRPTYANTRRNTSADIVRHAVSIDERRAFFRTNLIEPWRTKSATGFYQDVKEVWFPGVHGDVGGGYRSEKNPRNADPSCKTGTSLSHIALEWMLVEARENDLHLDDVAVRKALDGAWFEGMERGDPATTRHESLRWAWLLAEAWPKRSWRRLMPHATLGRRRRGVSYDFESGNAADQRRQASERPRGKSVGRLDRPKARVGRDVTIHEAAKMRRDAGADYLHIGPDFHVEPRVKYFPNDPDWDPIPNGAVLDPPGLLRPEARAVGRALLVLAALWGALFGSVAVSSLDVVANALEWPASIIAESRQFLRSIRESAFGPPGVLLVVWPVAFLGGIRFLKLGVERVRSRLDGETLLHARVGGYSAAIVSSQFQRLRPRERDEYRTALRRDFGFVLLYAFAYYYVWAVAGDLPVVLLALMLIGVSADIVENTLLLRLLRSYDPKRPISAVVSRIAGCATTVKISMIAVTVFGLSLGVLGWTAGLWHDDSPSTSP